MRFLPKVSLLFLLIGFSPLLARAQADGPPGTPLTAGQKLRPGDEVVARAFGSERWNAATVVELDGDQYKIHPNSSSDPAEIWWAYPNDLRLVKKGSAQGQGAQVSTQGCVSVTSGPLGHDEFMNHATGQSTNFNTSIADLLCMLKHRPVTFRLTPAEETRLLALRDSPELLAAVRAAYVAPAAPPKPAAPTASAAKNLTLGRYGGVKTHTMTNFGTWNPEDLTILPGNRYRYLNTVGTYSFNPKTRQVQWLSGGLPPTVVGFFYLKGEENSAYDTIVVRDKKDVAAGNKKDLYWFSCCGK